MMNQQQRHDESRHEKQTSEIKEYDHNHKQEIEFVLGTPIGEHKSCSSCLTILKFNCQ